MDFAFLMAEQRIKEAQKKIAASPGTAHHAGRIYGKFG